MEPITWLSSVSSLGGRTVAELGSDFTLIGAALAGLALTTLGIVRDLNPLRLHPNPAAKVDFHGVTS